MGTASASRNLWTRTIERGRQYLIARSRPRGTGKGKQMYTASGAGISVQDSWTEVRCTRWRNLKSGPLTKTDCLQQVENRPTTHVLNLKVERPVLNILRGKDGIKYTHWPYRMSDRKAAWWTKATRVSSFHYRILLSGPLVCSRPQAGSSPGIVHLTCSVRSTVHDEASTPVRTISYSTEQLLRPMAIIIIIYSVIMRILYQVKLEWPDQPQFHYRNLQQAWRNVYPDKFSCLSSVPPSNFLDSALN
jgi:hypothetical protein